MIGDPVPAVFPPGDPAARFVVAMAMARNDIDRALRDLIHARKHDTPDFTYRIRLVTGHLVEAIRSLGRYRQEFKAVRDLLARVPEERRSRLPAVMGALQRAGKDALEGVRDNTFHYPSPDTKYVKNSDRRLAEILALMSDVGVSFHVDGDTFATTMSFADNAALDLAMGRTADFSAEEALHRAEIARDAAFAFHAWFDGLMQAYLATRELDVGEPVWSDKPKLA